jgi:F-type H+-transporting ATPase subunit a
LLFVIEVFGLFIKHAVLAVRLFANIMGGHTVIGVMLAFIAAVSHSGIWFLVTPASIAGQIGVGLLELFVAFLQAYVFAFLATIFIGMGSHPH